MNDSFFTITGTLASNGNVTYNGITISQCLKMKNDTKITFNAESGGELVLVFGIVSKVTSKTVKIDGTSYNLDSNGIVTVELEAGEHTIVKNNPLDLYYISYTPAE